MTEPTRLREFSNHGIPSENHLEDQSYGLLARSLNEIDTTELNLPQQKMSVAVPTIEAPDVRENSLRGHSPAISVWVTVLESAVIHIVRFGNILLTISVTVYS